MKEWVMQNFDAAAIIGIITALTSLLAGITSLVSIFITLKKKKIVEKALQDAKLRNTYHQCLHCGAKTRLSDMHFFLEDGSKDDNLNGVPDSVE